MSDTCFEISRLQDGDSLPEIKKKVLQEAIDRYAEASGDFNPIHIDHDFAARTPLGGTIAHGMLILAYIAQMLKGVFGTQWGSEGSLKVRFKNPARPGDELTIGGRVRSITKDGDRCVYNCEIRCSNQNDETVISGEVSVGISKSPG